MESLYFSKIFYSINDCLKLYKKQKKEFTVQLSSSALSERYLEDKWSFADLAKALPNIENLGLICYYYNWQGLENFKNLKELFLGEVESMNILVKKYPHINKSYQYHDIDLLNYPLLEKFSTWTLKQIYNLEKTKIKKLGIGTCDQIKDDLTTIPFPTSIEELKLAVGSIINLKGIEKLENLEVLELVLTRKLESLNAIDNLPHLRKLKILECKKIDYNNFTVNKNIKDLSIQLTELKGGIPNLKFLKNLPNLENLCISSKVDDGNLSPVFDLPNLKRVWINEKKHNSHTNKQICEITGAIPLAAPEYII